MIFALVLGLLFTGMFALVADLGALFVAYDRLDQDALLAAQAGASAIDQTAFYQGRLRLDPTLAEQRCAGLLAEARVVGACTVEAGSVTAEVRASVPLPVSLFGLSAPVHVRHTASPAFGGRAAEVTA
ncbi:MAG TPA: hypothetical protein VFD01_02820 [Candidatus Dormibacteraeota bacterium]|nr:hypothetical protein [Candidatus Dormibacteraeota bacterium]